MSLYDIATDGVEEGGDLATPLAPVARQPVQWSRPDFDGAFTAAAQEYGVDPDVLRAMAHVESRFNPQAVSPAGAVGVMQFMPATAKRFGIDPTDPIQAIFGAAAYMRANLEKFGGDYEKAVAGYNAGENHRAFAKGDDWKGRLPGETRNYIESVLGLADQIKEEPHYQPLPRDVRPSTAGAGRGLVNPPLAAQQAQEPQAPDEPQTYIERMAEQERQVGAEFRRLKALNPGAPVDSIARMASDAYFRQRDAKPQAPVAPVQQYAKAYPGMGPLEAQQSAQFDARLQERLNRPFQDAAPDERGDRIRTHYNPLSAAQHVQAQDREQKDARQTVLDRDYTPEMTAGTLLRDTVAGSQKIIPTAIKSFTDLASMVTAGKVGRDTGKALDDYMKWIDRDIGSDRAQAQARNFARDMANEDVDFVDALTHNPGALADQLLPTVGSMALPVGAAGLAGKAAQLNRFSKGMEAAALAARVGRVQEAVTIGATVLQNASDSFDKVLDKGGTLERAYLAAGITAPFTLVAGKLTSGGAENALAMRLFNRANAAGKVTAQEAERFFPALAGAVMKEGVQESVEQLGQTIGESAGTGERLTPQRLAKEVAVAGTLGAAMGGGVHGFSGSPAPQAPKVQDQPTTPTVPDAPPAAPPAAPVESSAQSADRLAVILQREGLIQGDATASPANTALAEEMARIKAQAAPQPEPPAMAPETPPVVGSLEQNQAQVHAPQSFDATKTGANEGPSVPILQNRNRATPSSIAQMQSIASNPDYGRLGFSRDFANGAPVVAGGSVAPAQMGKQDVAVASDGRRIPVQYAVVEAGDVLTSNRADGTPNAPYGDPAVQGLRAIAGNGRIAGLQTAHSNHAAQKYTQELVADAALHGVDPQVVAAMHAPVLVRMMPASAVTANIGDLSNTTGNLNLSAVEQANNDANRVHLGALQFSEDGAITPEAVRQFVRAMPQAEQGGLIDVAGQPTRQAVDRLNAAVFAKAYGSDQLVRLYAQAQDPEARNVMSSLAQAAPTMARLAGAGALDIRGVVMQAAEIAVNARRDGKPIAAAAQQLDMAADPLVGVALDLFAANPRSVKPVVQALRAAADFAYTESNKPDTDMFGQVPRASREDVINTLRPQNERAGTQNLAQPRGGEPVQGDADRIAHDARAPADPAAIEAGRPAQAADPGISSYTAAEVIQRQRAQEQAQRQQEAQQHELEQRAQADAQRSEFTLTGSDRAADANPAQQGLSFSRGPSTKAKFESRVDALFSGEKATTGTRVLDRSDVMGLLGHPDVPLMLNERHLLDGLTNHPELTAQAWKKVPDWLESPAAVYTDPNHPGRLMVVAPERLAGYPVVMAVEPNPTPSERGNSDPFQLLVTVFAKTTGDLPSLHGLARFGRLEYADTKMAPAIWQRAGDIPRTGGLPSGAKRILSEKNLSGWRKANTPNYSFAGRNAATADVGTPVAAIRKAIAKAYGVVLAKLEARGLVTLAQTQSEAIDAAAQARADKTGGDVEAIKASMLGEVSNSRGSEDGSALDIKRSANGAIQGFYDPQTGKSFLISDNLSEQSAPGVLMHEVGIHMAADGSLAMVFKRAQRLLELGRGNAFLDGVRQRLEDAGETGSEEAAAYIVEAYENDRAGAPPSVGRWVKDFMASVRAWMFKHKILVKADDLRVADLAAIARANARGLADLGAVPGQAGSAGKIDAAVARATAPLPPPTPSPAPRSAWTDATGRLQFAPGKWLWDKLGAAAAPMLERVYLKSASPAVRQALRSMKLDVQRAMDTASEVAGVVNTMPADERAMVSDIIERELKAGVTPPAHAVQTAAMMNQAFGTQTDELVRLGMLSNEAANRWRGVYLPRYYASKMGRDSSPEALWDKMLSMARRRQSVMQGIKGKHLKGRGLTETVPTADLAAWQQQGWEVRDATFDPAKHDTVQVWRDFTRAERDQMGEIRDAGFRFVMGYMQTQKDIALGRMFESISQNPEMASRTEQEGFVKVPDTVVEGTGAARYGKLAGMYVPRNVMSQLSGVYKTDNAALELYRDALSQWKSFKTVYNPVAHVNNMVSNLTMAHLAGVSYWDAHKYAGAIRDLVQSAPMLKEARDAGLFLGSFTDEELGKLLPPDLQLLLKAQDSQGMTGMKLAHALLTWGLRRPAETAYEFGDKFFKYLIYKDARAQGLAPQDAVDHAQKFIFTYDDLPQGARLVRDVAIPFVSYTYKAIPALAETALTHPHRMVAPAAILHAMALGAYALAAGGADDDAWDKIKRYVTDPEFRAKADKMREDEYKLLPEWMKGHSALGSPKTIRLGRDEATQNPVFIDVSRFIPGGDLFDVQGNAGGLPWVQPLTPSNPLFSIYSALFVNKDPFTGKELTAKTDTRAEAAKKRADWLWKQSTPAIAIGNAHWDRMINAVAHANGDREIPYLPEMLGGSLTGIGKDGQPVQAKYAAMNTLGVKARPLDLDMSEDIQKSTDRKSLSDLEAELSQARRMNQRGALSDRALDAKMEAVREKQQRLRDGLTVDGEERP